ncbi:purine-binding chemotaxis protein CheW [Methanofollis aquaemaris]|uniref:Purine-binding chemotaxis protein CheW n=1 Tax=Methanofollis aquaemaris TaxID=126734 RepID=A0A8A3S6H8_9EURY|nr:chemotaxis protein CheW [Methanofollis aquaemaris]QSZ67459.1 purine-binding chemotaxis protein CheW [Methanofollis aquaemaris]
MDITDVVEFEIGGTHYALDINLAREIVEMVPITPIPRAASHIAGIINLRGEITTILNLNRLLGLPEKTNAETRKIIILVSEAANGSNTGIIVDDVHSVLRVGRDDVVQMDETMAKEAYVKGIIRASTDEKVTKTQDENLIIWIDLQKVIEEEVKKI